MVLYPVAPRSRTLVTGFTVQRPSQTTNNSLCCLLTHKLHAVHNFLHKASTHTKQSYLFVISWDGTEEEGVFELVAQAVGGGSIADLRDFQVRQDTGQVNGAVAGVRPHIQVNLLRTDHLSQTVLTCR